jgi:ABC-2 type transport system permease protein
VSTRDTIRLVARRELGEGLRSRAWRIGVAIQVVLIAGIAIVASVSAGDDGPSKRQIAVAGPVAERIEAAARQQQSAFGIELETSRESSAGAARQAVREGDVDAALVDRALFADEDPDETLLALLQSGASRLAGEESLRDAGLSPAATRAGLEPPPLPVRAIDVGAGEGGEGIAYIGALLLYVAIVSFGYSVASSVVSEKSSRVVEVILSAIRPHQLLAGKVLGLGILGLIQVLAILAAGLAAAVPAGAIELPSTTAESALLVLLYFVLGYLFYGCLFATGAALVSRQEDAQSATTPILIALIAAYIAANTALGNPDGALAVVGTFLPPMAPMVVPGRAAQGALPGWELALSLLLMLAAIAAAIWLAGRVYERSVLRFGKPVKLREALR